MKKVVADTKYLNVYVANNTETSTALSINQQYSETFLYNPSDYNVSVVKFSISTNSIPITLSSTATDAHRTVIVCYQTVGNSFYFSEQPIIWQESSYSATTGKTDYNQYDFYSLLDSINNAYEACFVDLATNHGCPNYPPVFSLDPSTGKITCTLDSNLTPLINNANVATFPGRPTGNESVWICTGQGIDNWLNYFYNVRSFGSNSPFPANLTSWLKFKQVLPIATTTVTQYQSSLDNIRQVTNIIITTSLPIESESIPLYSVGVNGNINNSNAGNSAELPILSEYSLLGNETLSSSVQLYLPTAEFRRTSIIGTLPINNLKIDVYYLSSGNPNDGQPTLVPLQLAPNSIFDLKLLFEKKG